MDRPLEFCFNCGTATGKAGQGDGSLYCECDEGPFCTECWHEHHQGNAKADSLRLLNRQNKELRKVAVAAEHLVARGYLEPNKSWRQETINRLDALPEGLLEDD